MANSTQVETDLATFAKSTFTAASLLKSAGHGMDLIGIANSAMVAGCDLKHILMVIVADGLDPADPALTLANNILGTLS
jgi:hypothetical protein